MFASETTIEQYRVKKYFIDLVFPVHKLGIEIDENNHTDRCKLKKKREQVIKQDTGFKIIRVNPDKGDFDVFDEIGEIQKFIIKSTKTITRKSTKKSMIDDTEKLTKMLKLL